MDKNEFLTLNETFCESDCATTLIELENLVKSL